MTHPHLEGLIRTLGILMGSQQQLRDYHPGKRVEVIPLYTEPHAPAKAREDDTKRLEAAHLRIENYIADMKRLSGPDWAALTNFVNAQFRQLIRTPPEGDA